jgi:hypothetical protein
MMYGNQLFNFGGGFAFWQHVHWIFVFTTIVGLILFLRWAFENLKKDNLKQWVIWLLIVGGVGMLLTSSFGKSGYRHGNFSGFGMMTPQMLECAQDEKCHDEMEAFMDKMMGFEK